MVEWRHNNVWRDNQYNSGIGDRENQCDERYIRGILVPSPWCLSETSITDAKHDERLLLLYRRVAHSPMQGRRDIEQLPWDEVVIWKRLEGICIFPPER
jgi:hypothetical protein